MRFTRTAALVGVGLLWLALGPVVVLLAAGSLYLARVRGWLRPTRRVVAAWVVAALALAGLAVVVPDGWVPIPPGAGSLVTPGYVGRPAREQPVAAKPVGMPHAAPTSFAGPLGESPHVWTRSYGVDGCRRLSVDSHHRLVGLCSDADSPVLRLVDAESLRQLAAKELPGGAPGCVGASYLDTRDRVVVATGDRRLLVVRTADGEGDADLTTESSTDLERHLPDDDCVVGVAPDRAGRTWFVSRGGRVGVVEGGTVRVLDLAEQVANPLTATAKGVYVVTVEAVYRLDRRADGRPVVTWRAAYDRGSRTKPGQATQGSGSPAAVLASGLVAVADNADPRMHVVVRRGSNGAEVCRAQVFGDDEGATDAGLVAAGDGFVVQNGYGYGGALSVALGRTTPGGLARVDVADGACKVTWTADVDAPSGTPAVSLPSGLVYAYTKRHSWLGANAWYLTALDLRTGQPVWAVRTGLGLLRDNDHGAVALGPDGSAYVPVRGGLVRVHDRD